MSRRRSKRAIKRPLPVEYMRWNGLVSEETDDGYSANEIMYWVKDHGGRAYCQTYDKTYLYVVTLEGEMQVSPGDYVVMGVVGEFYPVKPPAFYAGFDRAS